MNNLNDDILTLIFKFVLIKNKYFNIYINKYFYNLLNIFLKKIKLIWYDDLKFIYSLLKIKNLIFLKILLFNILIHHH